MSSVDSPAAIVQPPVDAIALVIKTAVGAVTAVIQVPVDSVTLAIQPIRQLVPACIGGSVGTSVQPSVDSVALVVEALVNAITAIVQALIDSIAAIVQALFDAIAMICQRGAAQRQTGQRYHGKNCPECGPVVHDRAPCVYVTCYTIQRGRRPPVDKR